ncbi:MAG TPA: hypothetical protein VFX70_20935 [Mycobacteriales bacterium]|nr:hypothetical protein [Mycobacteriales bacterium]
MAPRAPARAKSDSPDGPRVAPRTTGAPPASEFGAAHRWPGWYGGGDPDDDPDDSDVPGRGLTEAWPAG